MRDRRGRAFDEDLEDTGGVLVGVLEERPVVAGVGVLDGVWVVADTEAGLVVGRAVTAQWLKAKRVSPSAVLWICMDP